jgi:hypothetical protein
MRYMLSVLQANLALLDGPKSLIMRWAEFMLARLMSYVSWPVETLKFDDLLALYQQREQRDACAPRYTLQIEDNGSSKTLTQVTVSATGGSGSCWVPLMTPSGAQLEGTGIAAGPVSSAGVSSSLLQLTAPGGTQQVTATALPW